MEHSAALLRRQSSGLLLYCSRQMHFLRIPFSLQLMVSNADMKADFEKQGIDIPDFEEQLRRTVRQLLEAAAPQASQLGTGSSSVVALITLNETASGPCNTRNGCTAGGSLAKKQSHLWSRHDGHSRTS